MTPTSATQPAEFQDGGKPVSPPVYLTDPAGWSTAGTYAQSITAGTTADTIIKSSPGRLCRVLVTAAGTAAVSIWDNASGHTGTVIAGIPANAVAGTLVECQVPAAIGITVQGNASNPAITVVWS